MSAVHLIGLVAREYATPIPMVMKFQWVFFLALLNDYNDRMRREEEMYQKSKSGMGGLGSRRGSIGGY